MSTTKDCNEARTIWGMYSRTRFMLYLLFGSAFRIGRQARTELRCSKNRETFPPGVVVRSSFQPRALGNNAFGIEATMEDFTRHAKKSRLGAGSTGDGLERRRSSHGQNGNFPPRPFIRPPRPPPLPPPIIFIMSRILPGDFIIFRISPNCLSRVFTSGSEVPDPAAMR